MTVKPNGKQELTQLSSYSIITCDYGHPAHWKFVPSLHEHTRHEGSKDCHLWMDG
jgi:hypothetical protein